MRKAQPVSPAGGLPAMRTDEAGSAGSSGADTISILLYTVRCGFARLPDALRKFVQFVNFP